jgi:hypothetical protein
LRSSDRQTLLTTGPVAVIRGAGRIAAKFDLHEEQYR